MYAPARSYLRQMGDRNDLTVVLPHFHHDGRHHLGYLSAHACVDLVEDDGGQLHLAADHGFQREHDAGYLTTRSHLADGLKGRAGVGTEEEVHLVLAVGRKGLLADVHRKAHFRNAEWHQSVGELFLHLTGSFGSSV